ncbi:MAG: nuclear transport factor 2 family protein [Myxococcota bacterium]
MVTHVDIQNAVCRFFRAVDERAWSEARALMTDPFHLDYASFGAGDPADLNPDDVLAGWRTMLPGFDHTHHQLGNFELEMDGGRATVGCYGTATHVLEGRSWTVVGRYVLSLVEQEGRWKLSGNRFLFRFQDGDLGLPEAARLRSR